jgi:Uma2 family endonuclease
VEEYWIVLLLERRIEVYRRPESGTYRDHSIFEGGVTFECGSLPTVHIELVELFG